MTYTCEICNEKLEEKGYTLIAYPLCKFCGEDCYKDAGYGRQDVEEWEEEED